jgi:serine/threonine protein phosphatase 1
VWRAPPSQGLPKASSLPEKTRIYAIGDVHGRADLLGQVLSRIDEDLAIYPDCRALQVFLGDYIDRGPDSRAVVELLVERSKAQKLICLKGNHETYVAEFLRSPTFLESWRQLGGRETLRSYGLKPSINPDAKEQIELAKALAAAMPKEHHQFLRNLARSFTCGDFFFVHAGVRPGVPLQRQQEQDLLLIRQDFLSCQDDFGKVIVHGHSPVRTPEIRANRINIDTGAYASGVLTCLIIENAGLFVL